MAEEKAFTEIDTLVEEEVKITGLPREVIKEAVRQEIAARAAKRIADKIKARDRDAE